MPMERDRYPRCWERLAFGVKALAGWRCQECDRPCRKPGVPWHDFALWLTEQGCFPDLDKPQQWTLTVGHLDQNPSNNRTTNLKALCAGCHLRHDRAFFKFNRAAKLERRGQLNLLEVSQ